MEEGGEEGVTIEAGEEVSNHLPTPTCTTVCKLISTWVC